MKRKAQMEMIGLVIIVILITLGMLFMATFAFKKEPKKKVFTGEGLAYSVMGALMKTSVECEHYDEYGIEEKYLEMTELIKDCADNYEYPESSLYKCSNKPSCEFLGESFRDLLGRTLGEWGKHYEFKSSLLGWRNSPEMLIEIKDKNERENEIGCPGERETSGLFPINTDRGLIENVLYLCD